MKYTKEELIAGRLREVERPVLIGKIDEAYKNLKYFGMNNPRISNAINKEGMIVYESDDKVKRLLHYMESF